MRKVTILLAAGLLALTTVVNAAHSAGIDAFEQNRRLGRAVNILGYDPIWKDAAQARFQARHFQLLHAAGFTSVRINLQPFRFMKPADGYKLPASWLDVLDWAVKESLANHLMPILDLHEFTTMAADPVATRPAFLAFWRQIAEHCQHAPDSVLFEILNEPNKKLTPRLWNEYLRDALAIIRATNPQRTVVIGPAFWNSMDHLAELSLPENDRNIIVTVHYYSPMAFTHQGAGWTDFKKNHDVSWGTPAEVEKVEADFDKVAAWSREHNRPIFLGEFGAYDKAPMNSRVRYTAAVARSAERHGWSWAYWQFDSDFILYDIPHDRWVEPILHALIPADGKR